MSFSKNIIWSPSEYAKAAVLAREAGEDMLARLDLMTLKPNTVLDIGCGTGEMSERLRQRFPTARVLSFDLSEPMIQHAKQQFTLPFCTCADGENLPLRDQSVDFIFANFLLPWHANIPALMREWRRILRPDGLLMFTALGPDTLRDIYSIEQIPALVDMHDLGDLLLQVGFADPVLDVNYFTMSYREKSHLIHELQVTGMLIDDGNTTAVNNLEAVFEVVCGHAFAPALSAGYSADHEGIARVPVSALRSK